MKEQGAPRLSFLQEESKTDLAFDLETADASSMAMASLRAKWCGYAVDVTFSQKRAEQKRKERYKTLHEYYLTEYPLKVDRRDIDSYIEGNEEYQKLEAAEEYWKQTSKYVDGILQALDSASYNIGNAVKWAIFKQGGN